MNVLNHPWDEGHHPWDEGRVVHPLERAARLCMQRAADAKNWWLALALQNCALDIRSLPDWRVYL